MKVLVLSEETRYEKFNPDTPAVHAAELIFGNRLASEDEWLAVGADAEVLFATPVTPVSAYLIERMPNLKMIHSEGVGFDRIDLEAARKRGIYVCNAAGCNAAAVSEQTIMMMSMLLHRTMWGSRLVLDGHQGNAVEQLVADVPADLSISTVGLVGFGAIGQATAERLKAYGSTIYYYAPHRRDEETERRLNVEYLPLHELAAKSDIVSLHLPANDSSYHLVDAQFLAQMKPSAYLVNTARGAIIDDQALDSAIRGGAIAGVAVDCYEPEPATAEHPLVRLGNEFPDQVLLCPHQGGIAKSAFRQVHRMLYANLQKIMDGQRPEHVVNRL